MAGDDHSDVKQPAFNPLVDFVAGTVAGMGALAVGYPFDTVKVRFQDPNPRVKYRSTFHALSTIMREERFVGLYKGISSPMAACALMNGLVFASYRTLMHAQLAHDDDIPTLTQVAIAGGGTGVLGALIETPVELIKIQQQNTMAAGTPSTSARAVALQIFHQHGIRGLYRGISSTALRDTGFGAYFVAYEATCRYFATAPARPHDHSSLFSEVEAELVVVPWPALLGAGALAGVAGWIFTFPFDVIKTRMQGSIGSSASASASTGAAFAPARAHTACASAGSVPLIARGVHTAAANDPYRTMLSTAVHSYRAEGAGVFFRGLAPTLIRAVPVNMVNFAVFEAVRHALA